MLPQDRPRAHGGPLEDDPELRRGQGGARHHLELRGWGWEVGPGLQSVGRFPNGRTTPLTCPSLSRGGQEGGERGSVPGVAVRQRISGGGAGLGRKPSGWAVAQEGAESRDSETVWGWEAIFFLCGGEEGS